MVEIINNPEVSDAVMNRRTQAFLNDLGDWHQAEMEIRNMNVDAADQPGLILLISVYCHCLDLVDEWLPQLHRWLNQRNGQLTAASTKKIKRDVGTLAFLLGLIWLH